MKRVILPIGTIVELIECDLKIMIVGHLMKEKNSSYTYDYCGCIYPIGFVERRKVLYFNKSDIRRILKFGYVDKSVSKFNQRITDYLKEVAYE